MARWLTCMNAIPWERSSDGESSISLCRMKAGQSLYSWGNRPCEQGASAQLRDTLVVCGRGGSTPGTERMAPSGPHRHEPLAAVAH